MALAADPAVLPLDPTARPSGQTVQPSAAVEAEKTAMQPSAAAPKDWADEIKQPTAWLKWGADLRLRHEYAESAVTLDDEVDNESSYNRYRARAWFAANLADDITLNNRWVWEARYYWRPESREGFYDDYVIADQLNVNFAKLGGTDSFITIGRQDLSLLDGWLVMDGTPLDGSKTLFFDAARAQIDLKDMKCKLDLIVLTNRSQADDWSPIIMSDHEASLVEQDEVGGIIDFTSKSIENLQLDAFFMYKHADAVLANGDDGDIYLIGGRAERKFDEHVTGRIAGAYQWGKKDNPVVYPGSDGDLSAFGINSRLSYAFHDPMKNVLNLDFEFLSGDDPSTRTNEAFDTMWGRWPRFSDLFLYTMAGETRVGDYTNLYRLGANWQVQPVEPLILNFAYYALFADENTYAANTAAFGDDCFRGHLFLASARYKFNRFASVALLGEYLLPGNYYSDTRSDNGFFGRAELTLTF